MVKDKGSSKVMGRIAAFILLLGAGGESPDVR